jgi:hypothetical protein
LISCTQKKPTDWRLTFDKNSKQPYGCYLAYQAMKNYFPGIEIESGQNLFTEIDRSLRRKNSSTARNRLSIIVCRNFKTDSLELDKMIRYVKQGNTICIMAEDFSEPIYTYFNLQIDKIKSNRLFEQPDSILNQATTIIFNQKEYTFFFNGLPVNHAFCVDSSYHDLYYYGGYSATIDSPNRMFKYEGDGTLMICRNPVTMCNYFLLQNNNRKYLDYFFSTFSAHHNAITWYSFYDQSDQSDHDLDWLWLIKFPPLRYGFLLIIGLLLFYVLFESKRRQKSIPVMSTNSNSSLEFTETVGRLYYNKKDHQNLAEKMILHYLENVRIKYGLRTNLIDDEFILLLSQKINQSPEDTRAFLAYIRYIRDLEKLSEHDIKHLYSQLQKFI